MGLEPADASGVISSVPIGWGDGNQENMHKVHHHYVQPLTDTNYGNIFSIWDRLFRTFASVNPSDLVYGIDTHMKPEEHNSMKNLLVMPFQRYRLPRGAKFFEE